MIATITIESPLGLVILGAFVATVSGLIGWCLVMVVHMSNLISSMQEQITSLSREIERMRNGR